MLFVCFFIKINVSRIFLNTVFLACVYESSTMDNTDIFFHVTILFGNGWCTEASYSSHLENCKPKPFKQTSLKLTCNQPNLEVRCHVLFIWPLRFNLNNANDIILLFIPIFFCVFRKKKTVFLSFAIWDRVAIWPFLKLFARKKWFGHSWMLKKIESTYQGLFRKNLRKTFWILKFVFVIFSDLAFILF